MTEEEFYNLKIGDRVRDDVPGSVVLEITDVQRLNSGNVKGILGAKIVPTPRFGDKVYSLYSSQCHRLVKVNPPERGEIHDIIGYDESLLRRAF